ncbi:hypothetical protein SeMB42_g04538 [Synchytrium endobioticum]|uniref:Uncharacterized protein n=1 Tax=Synchytrium endobioticum TaxID=286115 RepID=A0A507CXJ1_9FUNG|nr:hypothetical protein SeLEV6574_g05356 [Synchytrium endobioticum]TPX43886.1 hypothetical protein SeMB42_g04538 [Synchytrium endobioticum]
MDAPKKSTESITQQATQRAKEIAEQVSNTLNPQEQSESLKMSSSAESHRRKAEEKVKFAGHELDDAKNAMSEAASERYQAAKDSAQSTYQSAKDTAGAYYDSGKDTASSYADAAKKKASDISEKASEYGQSARDSASSYYEAGKDKANSASQAAYGAYVENKDYAKAKASEVSENTSAKAGELKEGVKDTGVAAQNTLGDALEAGGESMRETGRDIKDQGLMEKAKETLHSVGEYLGLTASASEPEK